MFVLIRNGFSVGELAIALPARTYGSSKMTCAKRAERLPSALAQSRGIKVRDGSRWSIPFRRYRTRCSSIHKAGCVLEQKRAACRCRLRAIAAFYRVSVIKPQLERAIFRNFQTGARLLHAGCGSGQVDVGLQRRMKITGDRHFPVALRIYRRATIRRPRGRASSILDLPFAAAHSTVFNNLGGPGAFTEDEIRRILGQFFFGAQAGWKSCYLWPHARATSVAVLGSAHWMLNNILRKPIELHPPETSLLRSRKWVEPFFQRGGFRSSIIPWHADFFVSGDLGPRSQGLPPRCFFPA